jgi:Protein of unknown function (DUF3568)
MAGRTINRISVLVLAMALLINAGCLVVAGITGAALAGGAVASYVYVNGVMYRDYPSSLPDTASAVRAALLDLRFPVLEEKTGTGEIQFNTRTQDNIAVRIRIEAVASHIPVEGTLSRVAVRVGFKGNDFVSARILDQVSHHLVAPPLPSVPPPTTSLAPPIPINPAPPAPPETAAPPTAPPIAVSGTKK